MGDARVIGNEEKNKEKGKEKSTVSGGAQNRVGREISRDSANSN
jgi:hypothetical protein